MPAPKISVCIDVYNYADYLPEAIESVLLQNADFELIVGDDCSTDSSFEIAKRYAEKDSRIRVQRNARNLGMVRNRNACLASATGEYVKILHADDFLCGDDALGTMSGLLDSHPSVSLLACAMRYVDPSSKTIGHEGYFRDGRLHSGTSIITRCLAEQRNLIGGPSAVMFRRKHAGRKFDETYFHSADMEMWFHLLEQGSFAYVTEPLCAFRKHPTQQTVKDVATMLPAREYVALLKRYLGNGYVHLRRQMKNYLRFDAVARLDRRSRRLHVPDEGAALIREYGTARYYAQYPMAAAFRPFLRMWRSVRRRQAIGGTSVSAELPLGINVAGFIQGEYGIGDSSRAFCKVVEATGLPSAFVNITGNRHRHADRSIARLSRKNPYRVNLMTFSFDYARRFSRNMGKKFFRDRYNVALWYWELEQFPATFHSNFDYYDEIWTVTEFCRSSFASVSPIPVHKVPYPLSVSSPDPNLTRAALGLPDNAFLVLFTFDFCSEIERKNPIGLIRAFKSAFRPDEKAFLVLKSINSHRRPEDLAVIERELEGVNVIRIERSLPGAEMSALYAACDTYASLHRSEGLGLGMAQAMALGKPVVATGYSGNLEFMNPDNSRLVSHGMSEIQKDSGPYRAGMQWAEPDVQCAAQHLRWIFENREASLELGRRAAREIRESLDPARSAKVIRQRVEEIAAQFS